MKASLLKHQTPIMLAGFILANITFLIDLPIALAILSMTIGGIVWSSPYLAKKLSSQISDKNINDFQFRNKLVINGIIFILIAAIGVFSIRIMAASYPSVWWVMVPITLLLFYLFVGMDILASEEIPSIEIKSWGTVFWIFVEIILSILILLTVLSPSSPLLSSLLAVPELRPVLAAFLPISFQRR